MLGEKLTTEVKFFNVIFPQILIYLFSIWMLPDSNSDSTIQNKAGTIGSKTFQL